MRQRQQQQQHAAVLGLQVQGATVGKSDVCCQCEQADAKTHACLHCRALNCITNLRCCMDLTHALAIVDIRAHKLGGAKYKNIACRLTGWFNALVRVMSQLFVLLPNRGPSKHGPVSLSAFVMVTYS